MAVKRIVPPEPGYQDQLIHFLEHKDDFSLRDIRQRLSGDYASFCRDVYFVGEIGGQIASQMWYGLPKNGTGMGNFGHVYTEPCHRKKGIVNELMGFLTDDFYESDGRALFCSAARWVADIYKPFGFQFLQQGVDSGPMVMVKSGVARNFAELASEYFKAGLPVRVREGKPEDQFDCDKMLRFAFEQTEMASRWHRVQMAGRISSFMEALFKVQDQKGIVTVAETAGGSRVGYAFVAGVGGPIEEKSPVLDFLMHPNYLRDADKLLAMTMHLAGAREPVQVRCYLPTADLEKFGVLEKAGFQKEAVLTDYCRIGRSSCDLMILKSETKDV